MTDAATPEPPPEPGAVPLEAIAGGRPQGFRLAKARAQDGSMVVNVQFVTAYGIQSYILTGSEATQLGTELVKAGSGGIQLASSLPPGLPTL